MCAATVEFGRILPPEPNQASSRSIHDPGLDLAVVFLTQLIPSSSYPLRKELRALVYSSLIAP